MVETVKLVDAHVAGLVASTSLHSGLAHVEGYYAYRASVLYLSHMRLNDPRKVNETIEAADSHIQGLRACIWEYAKMAADCLQSQLDQFKHNHASTLPSSERIANSAKAAVTVDGGRPSDSPFP